MQIAVIGTGYVGLVATACFAEAGHTVVGADVDRRKIEMLTRGECPIYEPGLEDLLARNMEAERLRFTTNVRASVADVDVVFIAVGTPPAEDGSADLTHVLAAAKEVAIGLTGPCVVVVKSTVPVGSVEKVEAVMAAHATQPYEVASCPEFLKEGSALEDFRRPDRVVIGARGPRAARLLTELHEPFCRTGAPIIVVDPTSATLIKYAANAMLATRISFMNELSVLCDAVGGDVEAVRRGIGTDKRIGPAFLFAGPGWGGSCFPKDVKAIRFMGQATGAPLRVLDAVTAANQAQRGVVVRKVQALVGDAEGSLAGRRVAVWGLAFKANTDDCRESPATDVLDALLELGATCVVHDPVAMHVAADRYQARARETAGAAPMPIFAPHALDAVAGADALVVLTDWLEYRTPDLAAVARRMRGDALVDARNLYDPARAAALGFRYDGIGRGLHPTHPVTAAAAAQEAPSGAATPVPARERVTG